MTSKSAGESDNRLSYQPLAVSAFLVLHHLAPTQARQLNPRPALVLATSSTSKIPIQRRKDEDGTVDMVAHLPPAVKHMLTLRNPNSATCPPVDVLKSVFKKTRSSALSKGADQGWLAVSTATILTKNCPPALGHLYTFATQEGDAPLSLQERIRKAALMRETALKGAVFVGVPKVINGLAGLTAALDEEVKEKINQFAYRDAEQADVPPILARGMTLFKSIYDPYTEKLLAKLGTYHPDFPGFILRSEYGPLLAAPPNMPRELQISRALTSAMGVACLRADGGVGPQLTSHVFGLFKARGWEGETEEDVWLSSEEGAQWVIELTDAITDVIDSANHKESSKL